MGWRKNARDIIKDYPRLKRKEAELRLVSIMPAMTGIPSSHKVSRTTEDAAIKGLPPEEQKALDAVNQAIITTGRYRNGSLRLKIIELVFWTGSHTLDGAAMKCNVSNQTAYNWHNDFVALVDAYYRYV